MIEVNCALQLGDLFEPFIVEYRVNERWCVEQLVNAVTIGHKEADILNMVFVDARKELPIEFKAERQIDYVKHMTFVVLISEDGMDNSKLQNLPCLKNISQVC